MNPLSAVSAVTPLLGGLFNVVDELFTTDEERATAKVKLMQLQQQGALAQLAVNAEEAKSHSLFVSGWRPYIGWVCGIAFTWQYVFQPVFTSLILYVSAVTGQTVDLSGVPTLPMTELLPVLMGMLGLGYLRTQEKQAGVARTS